MFRQKTGVFWISLIAWSIGAALIGVSHASADSCSDYGVHRDAYLDHVGSGMARQLDAMAARRGVPVEAAAFYWGGTLMQAGDPVSLDSLAQLTLATARWPGQAERAERAMERISMEHGSQMASLLAGLMLSDGRGVDDPYRARAYLSGAARSGNRDASAFMGMLEACEGRRVAFSAH